MKDITIPKNWSARVLLTSAFIAACGSEAASTQEALSACGLLGSFEVKAQSDVPRCGGVAADESTAVVSFDPSQGVRIRLGEYDVPASFNSDTCVIEAEVCESSRVVEEGIASSTYRSAALRLSRTANGVEAQQTVTVARGDGQGANYRALCDGTASFALNALPEPAAGCSPVGEFEAAMDASLIEGDCELDWSAGSVSVEAQSDGLYSLNWSGTSIDDLTLNEEDCTLTGAKGMSEFNAFDFWSYNGAARSVSISLSFADGQVAGTVDDALEGETFEGVRCMGGRYSLAASVPEESIEVQRFDGACSVERPAICGDGVCDVEAGENCRCADCACADGQECESQTEQCLSRCDNASDDCGPGMRCGNPSGERLDVASYLYCITSDGRREGERCQSHTECGAGLACHYGNNRPRLDEEYGLCAPICTQSSEQCELCAFDNRSGVSACAQSCSREISDACPWEDAFCWDASTNATVGLCVAEPPGGLSRTGESCDIDSRQVQCEPPGNCIRSCRDGDCIEACTPLCTTAADCPTEFPRCEYGSCFPA